MKVKQVCSEADVSVAANLFREYQEKLNVDLCFQGFDRELAELPGDYVPPDGALQLTSPSARRVNTARSE